MQHPEKRNQEAKDKTSPGQCDPDKNHDNNNNSQRGGEESERGIHKGERRKGVYYYCPEPKKEKDIASKFTKHEKKNPQYPKKKKPKTKRN
jgi:hypothetical protein